MDWLANRHRQWAVVFWVSGIAIAATLWVLHGADAFALAVCAGTFDNLARSNFAKARVANKKGI